MTRSYERIWEFEIGPDQDIKEKLGEFVTEQGFERAAVLGAIGSIKNVVLTAPVNDSLPPVVMKTPCAGPGEVLAFSGEIMKSELMDPLLRGVYAGTGPLFIHIHASLACAGAHVYGGGLDSGRTFRGLKVYIAG